MPLPNPPLLVTHGGRFHCDEVLACAVLRLALGLHAPGVDHVLLRTRRAEEISRGDVVWDVGLVHDAARARFDHHQSGAPTRPDGTPYSSAGLVWQVHGVAAVAALLRPRGAESMAPAIAAELDATLILRVDEVDNGVSARGPVVQDGLGLAALVGDCNPPWDVQDAPAPDAAPNAAPGAPSPEDRAFEEAVALAGGVLRRRVEHLRARHAAEALVLAAHAAGADPRILVLERGMPWKAAAFAHALPVIYTVSPASNGNWIVDAMPPEPGSFAQRLPLPASWAGLQADALSRESGVPDAVFVHLRRFVGAARSREGARAMAERALKEG